MININNKCRFTFNFEKNSYQFPYFFSNKIQLEYFFFNLLSSLNFLPNKVHVNINFYNIIIYADVYPSNSSTIISKRAQHIFFAVNKAFYMLRTRFPNVKVFLHVLKLESSNKALNKGGNFIELFNVVALCYHSIAAKLTAQIIANTLIQSIAHQQVFEKYIKIFLIYFQQSTNKKLLGARFELKGRINGVDRSKKLVKTFGVISFQKQSKNINYGFSEAFTPSGKCSVHVWYSYKDKLHSMLSRPKKIKFIKYHRRKKNCILIRVPYYNSQITFGDVGLIAIEIGLFTARQIDIFRRVLRRCLQKKGTVNSAVFPDLPITKKPLATRIGKGKGGVSYWTAKVYPGTILFEVTGTNNELASYALKKASKKLSIKTKIIYR